VDLLCENALAIALEYRQRGMELSLGCSGGAVVEGDASELAAALAYPAAYSGDSVGGLAGEAAGSAPPGSVDLPDPPPDRGIIVLALPRTVAGGALDRFLKNRKQPGTPVDLAFLYADDALAEAAETCARLYNQRGGVHARQIRLDSHTTFFSARETQ
jgi:hypothetical protein